MSHPQCSRCGHFVMTKRGQNSMAKGMCMKCYDIQRGKRKPPPTPSSPPPPSNKRRTTIELPSPTKEANNITQRQQDRRLNTLDTVFNQLVGPRHTEEGERALLAAWLKRHKSMTSKALLESNLDQTGRLTRLHIHHCLTEQQ